MGTVRPVGRDRAARGAFVCLAGLLVGCRAAWESERSQFEATSAIGWREQGSEWENSSVPLMHFDGSWRPSAWPAGGKIALDLTGFTLDQTGEQTASLAVGVARTAEVMSDRLWLSLGAGHVFLDTERNDVFVSSRDTWQANYLEAGFQVPLSQGDRALRLGTELRYSWGDGPEIYGQRLDGESLDVLILVCFGP